MTSIQLIYMCRHGFEVDERGVRLCIPGERAFYPERSCPYCEDPARSPEENDRLIIMQSIVTLRSDHHFLSPDAPFLSTGGHCN